MKCFVFPPIVLLLIAESAFAGVVMAGTPFWKTPVENDIKASVSGASGELRAACRKFEGQVWDQNGAVQIERPGLMDTLRTLPLESDSGLQFSYSMKLSVALGENLKFEPLSHEVEIAKSQEALPDSVYEASEVVLTGIQSPQVQSQAKSLVQASNSLGLLPSRIRANTRPDGVYLEFQGKDALCDLVSGRASLSARVGLKARILESEENKINEFYFKVASITNRVLKEPSPVKRAALLGFYLGGVLPQDADPQKLERHLVAILQTFFNLEKMEPNSLWTRAPGGEKAFSVYGTSEEFQGLIHIVDQE